MSFCVGKEVDKFVVDGKELCTVQFANCKKMEDNTIGKYYYKLLNR